MKSTTIKNIFLMFFPLILALESKGFSEKIDIGGQYWEQLAEQSIPLTGQTLFVDEKNGYSGYDQSIYQTNDGGETWKQIFQFQNVEYSVQIRGLHLQNQQLIIHASLNIKAEIGKNKAAFYTLNLSDGKLEEHIYSEQIERITDFSPFVKSGDLIIYSYDNGFRLSSDAINWQEFPPAPGYKWYSYNPSFSLKPDGTITAIRHLNSYLNHKKQDPVDSQYCEFQRSANQWQCREIAGSVYTQTAFYNQNNGVMVSMVGSILNSWPINVSKHSGPIHWTKDGGSTWTKATSESLVLCSDVKYVTESYIIAACKRIVDEYHSQSILYSSNDAGNSWQQELLKGENFPPDITIIKKGSQVQAIVEFSYWEEGDRWAKQLILNRTIP